MTKCIIIKIAIFITLTSNTLFAQSHNDSLLATFYNKVLLQSFSKINGDGKEIFSNEVIIKTDFDTSRWVKNVGSRKFVFLGVKDNEHAILKRPYKKNKGRSIYRIKDTIFGKDTIDINIGAWTIASVDKRRMSILAPCGGALGYIPTARFIFDNTNGTWTFVSEQEMIDSKLVELKGRR